MIFRATSNRRAKAAVPAKTTDPMAIKTTGYFPSAGGLSRENPSQVMRNPLSQLKTEYGVMVWEFIASAVRTHYWRRVGRWGGGFLRSRLREEFSDAQ